MNWSARVARVEFAISASCCALPRDSPSLFHGISKAICEATKMSKALVEH